MKKSLALLISICLILGLYLPISSVNPSAESDGVVISNPGSSTQTDDGGLHLNKTLTKDETTGKFSIDLEAYTTGSVSTTTKAVPTDIVLVLDQSGSMAEKKVTRTTEIRTQVSNQRNEKLYSNKDQLYIQDEAGNWCKVSVSREATSWFLIIPIDYKYTYSYTPSGATAPVYITTADDANGSLFAFDGWNLHYSEIVEEEVTRLVALKDAVNAFLEDISKKSLGADATINTEDDVEYRVAIIGFASSDEIYNSKGEYFNTGLLSTPLVINYKDISKDGTDYKNAFVRVTGSTNGVLDTRLSNAVNNISGDGGTCSDLGLEMAQKVLINNPITSGEKRNRVVVMLTDGEPGKGGWNGNSTDVNVANRAIVNSQSIKSSGASVFTIGILDGANPESSIRNNDNSNVGRTNRYMHYVSSNYPNATSLSNGGAGGSNAGYYMVTSGTVSLESAFETISDSIVSPSVSLDSTTVIKDIISPYFNLPTGATGRDITIKTAAAKSDGTFETSVIADESVKASILEKTISVTGFDFNSNAVTTTDKSNNSSGDYGRKLIITIPLKFDSNSTFGGNAIPSNGTDSGLYTSNGTCVLKFAQPTVDVPITYGFSAVDQSIYLTRDANLANSFVPSAVVNGENNKFVDIVYTIKDGTNVVATYRILNGLASGFWDTVSNGVVSGLDADKKYTITCNVTPITTGSVSGISDTQSKTVFVYVPNIKATDDEMYLGDEAINITDNTPLSGWNGTENAPTPSGTAPTLAYEYYPAGLTDKIGTPNAYAPIETTDVNVKVFVGSTDITDKTLGDKTFTVKVRTCSLTITNPEAKDDQQRFLYTVTGSKGNSYEVAITGSEKSRTLTGLPVDTYTVECKTDWAWSFSDFTNDHNGSVTLTKNKAKDTIKFTAKYADKWLSDEDGKENVFNSVS